MIKKSEVAVIGAGPSGMNAAIALAQSDVDVVLIDNKNKPGGQYYRQPQRVSGSNIKPHQVEGYKLWKKLKDSKVEIITDTNVWGAFDQKIIALDGKNSPKALEAKAVILATGAFEKTIAFPGWELPGIMTLGAAQAMLENNILPGKRIVISGTGPLNIVVAADLINAGAEVVMVLEGNRLLKRGIKHFGNLFGQLERLQEGAKSWFTLAKNKVEYRTGYSVILAKGNGSLDEVTICALDDNWKPLTGSEENIKCDALCIGYGFNPFNTLSGIFGVECEWRPELGGDIPIRDQNMQSSIDGVFIAGDCAGIGGGRLAVLEGRVAGLAAARYLGKDRKNSQQSINELKPNLARERRFQKMYSDLFIPRPGIYDLVTNETILCRCEGITLSDIQGALALGADSVNEVKVITRACMGDCQGRMCHQIISQIVSRELGKPIQDVDLVNPRPPVFPVSIDNLCKTETTYDDIDKGN